MQGIESDGRRGTEGHATREPGRARPGRAARRARMRDVGIAAVDECPATLVASVVAPPSKSALSCRARFERDAARLCFIYLPTVYQTAALPFAYVRRAGHWESNPLLFSAGPMCGTPGTDGAAREWTALGMRVPLDTGELVTGAFGRSEDTWPRATGRRSWAEDPRATGDAVRETGSLLAESASDRTRHARAAAAPDGALLRFATESRVHTSDVALSRTHDHMHTAGGAVAGAYRMWRATS
jgi:hypothetical protein